MKDKIIVIVFFGLLVPSILGFSYAVLSPASNVLVQERAHEKSTFDYQRAVYNDKANTRIRAENSIERDVD